MSVLFLGGDVRSEYACAYLNARCFDAQLIREADARKNIEKIKNYSVIALPLPLTRDGVNINGTDVKISDFITAPSADAILIGTGLDCLTGDAPCESGLKFYELNDNHYFRIMNALYSAEGGIYYSEGYFDRSIYGADVAVLGFGKIGKLLTYMLLSRGARVSVSTRRESDISLCSVLGIRAERTESESFSEMLSRTDMVFNTIPHHIIGEEEAKKIKKSTPIIDLASAPYGIDPELVAKNNLNYHIESGIPGRYAPRSAGELIGKTIIDILNNKGDI